MIEDGFLTVDLSVDMPVATLRAISHDPSCKHLLTLRDGRKMTAVQLQMEYLEQSRKYVEDRFGADVDDLTTDVLDRWESVLHRLGDDPMQLSDRARLGRQARAAGGLPQPRRPRLVAPAAPARRPAVLRHPPRPRPVQPARRARADQAHHDRRRGRGGDRGPAGGHPRLLPRPLPAPVRRLGRRGLLGLGDLRRARPRVAAARTDPGAAAGHQGARRRPPGPLPYRLGPRDGPDGGVDSGVRSPAQRHCTAWVATLSSDIPGHRAGPGRL